MYPADDNGNNDGEAIDESYVNPDFKPEITTQLVKDYNTTTKTSQVSSAVVQAEVKTGQHYLLQLLPF